jgi:Predicted hydrolase of the HD superfamily (permuted catalytic motifs)
VKIRDVHGDKQVYVDVKTINSFLNFIPSKDLNVFGELKEIIGKLLQKRIDISFSCFLTNSWHPFKEEENRLKDLDDYDLIAVGKMDCDKLGDVRRILSYSPSRLVTFSEILNIVLAGKSYLRVFAAKEAYGDVIPLYASGDDAVFYGDWFHVIQYMVRVYEDIRKTLPPLSLSMGITMDKNTTPLLLLYGDVIELLEKAKRGIRGVCALRLSNPILVQTPDPNTYELIDVIPLEPPSRTYPWPDEVTGAWSLKCLAKVLEHIRSKTAQANTLAEYKRGIYLLSLLGAKISNTIESTAEGRK